MFFSKKQIFLFIVSFIIIFVACFFVWNTFFGFDKIIGPKIFLASVSGENIISQPDEPILAEESTENGSLQFSQEPVVLSEQEKQDLLDNIAEKIDILQQQVNELINENKPPEEPKEDKGAERTLTPSEVEGKNKQTQPKITTKSHTSSGGSRATYPKILISEVQISPISERFIELYNPTNQPISLTDWYLQRKTKTADSYSSFVSSTLFAGQTIGSGDYFLISREILGSNILSDITITEDNSLALKNPNGEVSDKLGFGLAQDYETSHAENPPDGQSIGRKFDEAGQTYLDTDNNSTDFELDTRAPKAKNIKYIAPPVAKNILINEVQISPTSQRFVELYNPNSYCVDLTGYYLQRKTETATSWSSFVSSSNFENEMIGSNDYFLISKEVPGSDLINNISFTGGNSYSLVLKNSDGVVADKVGWGAANDCDGFCAFIPENYKSIGRINFVDTNDNNDDFAVFDVPTPRKENK